MVVIVRAGSPFEAEIRLWLEWSGATLLALQLSSPSPKGVRSNWPEYAQEAATAYGYTPERLRAPTPRSEQIELMDKILVLPEFIDDSLQRRIVHARLLVTPVSNRHVYSYPRLARFLGKDQRTVARLFFAGLHEIAEFIPQSKASLIRKSFAVLS